MDRRRIRDQGRDHYGLYIRLEDQVDITRFDAVVKELRYPPNREVLHVLLEVYAQNKIDEARGYGTDMPNYGLKRPGEVRI
jgi:hypothetical protein